MFRQVAVARLIIITVWPQLSVVTGVVIDLIIFTRPNVRMSSAKVGVHYWRFYGLVVVRAATSSRFDEHPNQHSVCRSGHLHWRLTDHVYASIDSAACIDSSAMSVRLTNKDSIVCRSAALLIAIITARVARMYRFCLVCVCVCVSVRLSFRALVSVRSFLPLPPSTHTSTHTSPPFSPHGGLCDPDGALRWF